MRSAPVFVLAAVASLVSLVQLSHFPYRVGATAHSAVAETATHVPPEAPRDLTVLSQSGARVTFGWSAPLTGPTPTAYVIEGSVWPGDVLASIPTSSPASTITLDAPTGAFYVRVHAVAEGLRSVASNEIRIFVNVAAPPSAPAHLLGLVNGDTLTLSWLNTFAGGAPTRLWLTVSGALQAALPIPLGETFSFASVPPGTYTLALVAENAAGVSAPSNPVTLSFPTACSGPPRAPTRFASWREGSTLFVSWRPPEQGPAVASFTVSVSGAVNATFDTTAHIVSGPLGAGEVAISVSGNNACGRGPAAPDATAWTTTVVDNGSHVVHWSPIAGAAGYQVYWSTSREEYASCRRRPNHAASPASPFVVPAANPSQPLYARVFPVHGPVNGTGGPIAVSPSLPWSTTPTGQAR